RMIGVNRLPHPLGRERLFGRRKVARQAQRDLAFDADTDVIAGLQRHAAVVHALFENAAAAGVRYLEISLHHRAGAADLVADQAAQMRQQEIVHGALDQIALGLVLWRDFGGKRRKRAAIAAGGGDRLGGTEDLVHAGTLSRSRASGPSSRSVMAGVPASGLFSKGKRAALKAEHRRCFAVRAAV